MYRRESARSRSWSPPPRSTRSQTRTRSRAGPAPPSNFRTPSHSPAPTRPAPAASPNPPGRAGRGRAVDGVAAVPTPRSTRRSRQYPAYDDKHDPGSPVRRSSRKDVTLLLAVFSSAAHKWRTCPVTFRPDRVNDREVWEEIRETFRTELRKPWHRLLGFKRVTGIVPIAFSPNMVPLRTNPNNFPASHQLVNAYHHPWDLRTEHEWVDYLTSFEAADARVNGLEFVEGVWAEKLLVLAGVATSVIVAICIVWTLKGGELQTVFTVMGFVLTLVAAEIALLALYYQIQSGTNPLQDSS